MTLLHHDELPIDRELVVQLLHQQFPQFSSDPLEPFGVTGSSNRIFRLGADKLVRLPRQASGSQAIVKEARWLTVLADELPVQVPEVIELGTPSEVFPYAWSIVRYLPGERVTSVSDSTVLPLDGLARDLADFVRCLRRIEVPANAGIDAGLQHYRGDGLLAYNDQFQANLDQCRNITELALDYELIQRIWQDALAQSVQNQSLSDHADNRTAGSSVPAWFHGDLVAENFLLKQNRLSAVLDFGGLGVGDPSIDLHGVWELFDTQSREVFRTSVDVDDRQWAIGRAWALAVGLMTFPYYWHTLPGRVRQRLQMVHNVLLDAKTD